MEKAQFVVSEPGAWWLVNPNYYAIEEPRRQLGQALGYLDVQWYLQVDKLEEWHRQLEVNHYQLLADVDNAVDDTKRIEWLIAVKEAFQPKMTSPASGKPAQGTARPSGAAENPALAKSEAAGPTPADVAAFAKQEATAFDGQAKSELANKLHISQAQLDEVIRHLPADFDTRVAAEAARLAREGV
jgi:hypothetical protein